MIVSIHIPKTAGKSFRLRLESLFGPRLLTDYAGWIRLETPEAKAERAEQAAQVRARCHEILRDYDVIHGHFIADKYADIFPTTNFTAFFRDPYQQAVSHYEFLLRHPGINNFLVKKFHEVRPTLPELIAAIPNVQAAYLGRLALEDLAMIGLTEQYARSVALFEAIFGLRLPPEREQGNVNPNRGEAYEIDAAVRKAVDIHRAGDVELYRRARELFAQLTARYDVQDALVLARAYCGRSACARWLQESGL